MPTVTVDSASSALAKGDWVCLVSDASGMEVVAKVTAGALATSGIGYGIATAAAQPGARVAVKTDRTLASSVTGLAAGNAGPVRINTTTGRCERVASFQQGDFPAGFVDARGVLLIAPGQAVGGVPGPAASVDTRASMQAITTPTNGRTVTVAEVGGKAYRWIAGDTTPADGWYSLTANDASNGRWILQGDAISLAPLGGASDDWPRLIDACGACAPNGVEVHLRGGTWLAKSSPLATGLYLPNNTVLVGSPSVSVVQTITTTGSALETAFAATFTVSGAVSTVSTNAVKGSRTVVVTGAPGFVVGDYILVEEELVDGIRAAIYKVRALSGSGPYTITVDRPILFNFVIGDRVQKCTPAQGIKIYGKGMRVSGSGARLVELYGAVDCEVEDIIGDASQCTERALSIDVGSYNCHVRRCHFDNGAGSCLIGLSFESTEACSMEDCVAIAFAQNGHFMQDAQASWFTRCASYVCGTGHSVSTGAGGFAGSNDNVLTDCAAMGCTSAGFVLGNGSSRNTFKGCVSSHGPQGFSFQSGGTLSGNSFVGCKTTKCTTAGLLVAANGVGTLVTDFYGDENVVGIRVDAGAKGTRIHGANVYRSTSTGCTFSDECSISGGVLVDCAIGVAVSGLGASSTVRMRDLEITSTANGWAGVQVTGGTAGRAIIDGCKITTTGTGSLAIQHLAASTVVLSNVEGSGGAGSYGYAGVSGSTVDIQGTVDFSRFPTPFLIDAGGVVVGSVSQTVGATTSIMWVGDSNTAGSNGDEVGFIGGWREAVYTNLRKWRGDFDFVGSKITVPESHAFGLWYTDGTAGHKIEDITAEFAGYVSSPGVGVPNIIIDSIGTNNIVAGDSLGTMQTKRTALDAAYAASAPNAKVIVMPVLPFVAGTTTGANLAAWESARSSYNSWLQTYVLSKPNYQWLDASSQLALGDYQRDGVHLTRGGQSSAAQVIADHLDAKTLGQRSGPVLPRSFKQRLYQSAVLLATTGTDGLTCAAHSGFNPASGSYALALDYYPTDVTGGLRSLAQFASYTSNPTAFFGLYQTARLLAVYWANQTGTIYDASHGHAVPATTLAANKWHRIVLIAHQPSLTVGLYVNGGLVGLVQGVPSWSFSSATFYVGKSPEFSSSLGYVSRVHAYKGVGIPRPGSMAALLAVEGDYYSELPIAAGYQTASFALATTLTDNINGNPAMSLVGGASAAGAYPGGSTPLRPWEYQAP